MGESPPHAPERERSRSPREPGNDSGKAMWRHSWIHRERRDQIYSMPPGPPPPMLSGGPMGGGGAAAAWHPWKIDSLEVRDRTCPRCSKVFGSPKAMFGHLHVHYEKAPTVRRPRPEPAPVQAPPVVVDKRVEEEEDNSPAPSIDLNRPAQTEEEGGEEVGNGEGDSPVSIDLNRTPPGGLGDDTS